MIQKVLTKILLAVLPLSLPTPFNLPAFPTVTCDQISGLKNNIIQKKVRSEESGELG